MIDTRKKEEYIRDAVELAESVFVDDKDLRKIFKEIRDKQSSKKNNNVEGELLSSIGCFHRYDKHLRKNAVNYSGSQGALFLMARIFAVSKILQIDFPIIIDHFRGGELSSIKEEKVIDLFKLLNKQVIFTCTLKDEEKNKYVGMDGVNDVSFDGVEKFHLLTESHNEKFREILNEVSINLELQ